MSRRKRDARHGGRTRPRQAAEIASDHRRRIAVERLRVAFLAGEDYQAHFDEWIKAAGHSAEYGRHLLGMFKEQWRAGHPTPAVVLHQLSLSEYVEFLKNQPRD